MKIISNKECYIQGQDLDYLIDNGVQYSNKICAEAINQLGSMPHPATYFQVKDPESIEFIRNFVDIPDFEELYSKDICLLKRLCIKIEQDIREDYLNGEIKNCDAKSMIDTFKRRRNKEYILNQIREMIAYKKGLSHVEYPNVANPAIDPLDNGSVQVYKSIQPKKAVVHNVDGELTEEDKSFATTAFRLLMEDENLSDDTIINLAADEEKKTVTLSPIKKRQKNAILRLIQRW